MSKRYFSTFITGTGEIVRSLLSRDLQNVKVHLMLDGLVVFETDSSVEKIKQLKFINNSFELLESESGGVELLMEKIINKVLNSSKLVLPTPQNKSSFRIMFSKENQPVSAGYDTLLKLEKRIGSDKLHVNRSNPNIEFLFLVRREGQAFFGLRLTRHMDYKKLLQKGELRPELAYMMCELSEPDAQDVFMDPFSGNGSIEKARSNFASRKIIANDKAIDKNWDATNLNQVEAGTVDKIVTDPPWGRFEQIDNIDLFYEKFLREFGRVLRQNGIVVILIADKTMFENVIININAFKIVNKYDILVSGKKSAIYKLMKN